MGEHTPGPWKVYIGSTFELGCHVIRDSERGARDGDIATMIGKTHARNAANARLIAAAPELLAACKESLAALVAVQEEPHHSRSASMVSSAEITLNKVIAKAEGNQS